MAEYAGRVLKDLTVNHATPAGMGIKHGQQAAGWWLSAPFPHA